MNKASMDTLFLFRKVMEKNPNNELMGEICKRHDKYNPDELLQEILEDGSNTIATFLRGCPIEYDEILRDVADKLDVKYEQGTDYQNIELALLAKVIQRIAIQTGSNKICFADMDGNLQCFDADKGEFAEYISKAIKSANRSAVTKSIMIVLGNVLRKNVMEQGIKLVSPQVAKQVAYKLGPILNIIMGACIVIDIAGPAYRKTIPTIINISMLRLQESCDD